MFGLFEKAYEIRVEGPSVYVKCNKPIEKWKSHENDEYLKRLNEAVAQTVTHDVWASLQEHRGHDDDWYRAYTEGIRQEIIEKYQLDSDADEVSVGNYHCGMLVIGFRAREGIEYPCFFKGIQLKPIVREET